MRKIFILLMLVNLVIIGFSAVKDRVKKVQIVFVLDITGSMQNQIDEVKTKVANIVEDLRSKFKDFDFEIGLVGFRDKGEQGKIVDFTSNVKEFLLLIKDLKARGGGDTPEDDIKALMDMLELNWATNSIKIAFLITDAPVHTNYYKNFDLKKFAKNIINKGIVVNTICYEEACNDDFFKELAKYTDGRYKEYEKSEYQYIGELDTLKYKKSGRGILKSFSPMLLEKKIDVRSKEETISDKEYSFMKDVKKIIEDKLMKGGIKNEKRERK